MPDSQKILQGHNRFIKNVPEVKPIDRMWPVPRDLGDSGKALWRGVGPLLVSARVLTELDRPMFMLMCSRADTVGRAQETIEREGFTVIGHGGIQKSHPAINALKNGINDLIRLMEKFGLSPADRNKIDLPVDAKPEDAARKFLFGSK